MSINNIPPQFKIDSEEDVRVLVCSYFSELGFDLDEISCEDHFSISLGHSTIQVNKKNIKGHSDILIARNKKPLAIVETKKPSHKLTDQDAIQAISYARLLSSIAPFAIVTNGKDTKVYDVLADGLKQIESPENSIWHLNGQKNSFGISEELKSEAAKILVATNPETLDKFCKLQVSSKLSDLKSDIKGNKKYIPELYIERVSLNQALSSWLQNTLPVFAIIAQSGYGKTNFMCAKAEELSDSQFVLFYSAGKFVNGIAQAIKNDFTWEFHRDKEVFHIFERYNSIAQETGKKFLIFIDALDENPTGIKALKNEILDLVEKMRNYPNIKLVVSCKFFDWSYFVVDDNQSFNLLANSINPLANHTEISITGPESKNIGLHFSDFTNEELMQAITKYKTAFKIDGDFRGEALEESRNPLMLRFISEIYSRGVEKIPSTISKLELFNLYYQRKVAAIENKDLAEIVLTKIAFLVFTSGSRSISKDQLWANLQWSESYDKVFQALQRIGILEQSHIEEHGYVNFVFNKFLLYFQIFKAMKIHSLPPDQQVDKFQGLINLSIGIESLEFFLVAVSQPIAHKFLMEYAKQYPAILFQILTELRSLEIYNKTSVPEEHLLHYLEFYNHLRSTFIDKLKDKVMPYYELPLGLIIVNNSPVKFRACSPTYPQPIIELVEKVHISQLFKGPMSLGLKQVVMPVGPLYLGGNHEFSEYPQKASYNHLIKEVSTVISDRMLDETMCKDIIKERIYGILLNKPTVWLEGDDLPIEHYWKLLGYKEIEELESATVLEIKHQVRKLLDKFQERLKKNDALFPSYLSRSKDLFATYYALNNLDENSKLEPLPYSVEKLLGIKGAVKPDIEEVKKLIPLVINNYKLLFQANFPKLATYSPFYNNIEKLSVVEIIHNSNSDFPLFSYMVCCNVPQNTTLNVINTSKALIKNVRYETIKSRGHHLEMGEGCGFGEANIPLGNETFHEPDAWVIRARFASQTPILDQVYNLISHELKYLFNARHLDWKEGSSWNLANDRYLEYAQLSLMNKKEGM